jgi:hypothetical protein
MNYELMHFNRPDAHMQCQSRKLFSRSQGSARRHLSAAAVQASLLLGMFPSDGYMLMEENGAEPASRTARARPRRRSCILRVAVGEGDRTWIHGGIEREWGKLNRETRGIWQPALVRPQRPAAGRAVGGSGEQGGG